MAYLNDFWMPDPIKSSLFRVVDNAVTNSYDASTQLFPSAVCVDANQIDVWVVFTNSDKVGQFRRGQFIKFINVGKRPMGIAQAPDGSLYVACYQSCTVSKIVNGTTVMNISVGAGPRGICVSPDGCVWVSNFLSNTVTKIVNDVKVKDIYVAANPYGICSDKYNNIYVACSGSNVVSKITGITKMLDIKVGKTPYGVCSDSSSNVWVTLYNGGSVQHIVSGVAKDEIGVGTGPFAIAPAKDGSILVGNYLDGTVTRIVGGMVSATIRISNNVYGFGDFTGYQAYMLFKETNNSTTGAKISFDDLDADMQQKITNSSISYPLDDALVGHDDTTYDTVKKALDFLLYKAPSIVSFTNNIGIVEIGSTVTDVNLNWVVNKTMGKQTIDNGVGNIPVGTVSKALTGLSLNANTTWTLTVTDDKNASATKSTTLSFQNKRYFGTSASTALTNTDIIALGGEFGTDYKMSKTLDASGGKYLYFVVPSSFGLDESHFKIGGLANSDWVKTTMQFTNASGYKSNYDIFRSTNLQTGSAIPVDIA